MSDDEMSDASLISKYIYLTDVQINNLNILIQSFLFPDAYNAGGIVTGDDSK